MNKLSRIVVKDMMVLSNEEMAMINGGDDSTSSSTTKDVLCSSATQGQACYYDKANNIWGTCTRFEHYELGYISIKYICYYQS